MLRLLGAAFALSVVLITSCAPSATPIEPADTISIEELAQMLTDSLATRPLLLHVGFPALYRSGHIPGSQYVGAGNSAQGIAGLKRTLASVPADQHVVLYCGCCPWEDCPNVRPAFQAARESGHTQVRVLYVTGNLERDWTNKGLPTATGDGGEGASP